MKPLIILKYPKRIDGDELEKIATYLRNHQATADYHFIVIKDAEYEGEIQFIYFNEDGLNQTNNI